MNVFLSHFLERQKVRRCSFSSSFHHRTAAATKYPNGPCPSRSKQPDHQLEGAEMLRGLKPNRTSPKQLRLSHTPIPSHPFRRSLPLTGPLAAVRTDRGCAAVRNLTLSPASPGTSSRPLTPARLAHLVIVLFYEAA